MLRTQVVTAPMGMGLHALERIREREVRGDHARLIAQARANLRPRTGHGRIRRYFAFKFIESGLRLLASTSPTTQT